MIKIVDYCAKVSKSGFTKQFLLYHIHIWKCFHSKLCVLLFIRELKDDELDKLIVGMEGGDAGMDMNIIERQMWRRRIKTFDFP